MPASNPRKAAGNSTEVDNTALASAISALSAAIAAMRPPPPPIIPPPVLDPFASTDPFDLSSRAGASAYQLSSSPLDELWDGTVASFPSMVVSLRLRSRECRWNAPSPQGILKVGGQDILTNYHSITNANIETARTNRTNSRAIQNSKAMFRCLKSSIKGDLKDTIFTQYENLPEHEDGISLFKQLTTFTTVASLQLSMISFQNILNFDPSDFKFNIPVINGKLIHLFVLATTQTRSLLPSERIQHTMNVYSKVLQPEAWAQWVRNKIDSFELGTIVDCQDFMNSAVMKYNQIVGRDGDFGGSITTVQADIVAMFAKDGNKRKTREDVDEDKNKRIRHQPPPFLTHFKNSSGTKYTVGDKREWNNHVFYFCDAPTHKDRAKWHTHTADTCRTRQRWLKGKESGQNSFSRATANVGKVDTNSSDSQVVNNTTTKPDTDQDNDEKPPSLNNNITTLLASALNAVGDNEIVRDLIADAINAAS